MAVIIKSFAVRDEKGVGGDMFYIKHASSNFTIIDCCFTEINRKKIVDEIKQMKKGKHVTRFISTHPDEDHICGLEYLDKHINILNFYCVENKAKKPDHSPSFSYYCKLRDNKDKHYYVHQGCKRKWMNDNDVLDGKNYGSSEINFLWPDVTNKEFKKALALAEKGNAVNNLSPIFTYSGYVKAMWMGDMEDDFLEKVKDQIEWPEIDILFAPHHGRKSGTVPKDILKKLNPTVIVIGVAPSEHLNYYQGYDTITQNSAGDITFQCSEGIIDVYISKTEYKDNNNISCLIDDLENNDKNYLGSFFSKLKK